jgi:dTDP-4-dehydrorhamnose reductase
VKILVTGANGQLGVDVVKKLSVDHAVTGLGREELDVIDLDECIRVLNELKPDVVIHCASYTLVDLAEREYDQAYLVNAVGSQYIAIASEEIGAKLVFISTDYVFDGKSDVPYSEDDQSNPASIYGKSKLAGEQYVQSYSSKYFIVRTSWLYGRYGNNFVKTMLKLSKGRDMLTIVNDQIGSPTYTVDLVNFLSELIQTDQYGIYHASNTGSCTWYDFACAIFEEKHKLVRITPCTTEEYKSSAPRPQYSVLEHAKMRLYGFPEFRHWRAALHEFLLSYNE